MPGESAHVHLINHSLGKRTFERRIPLPVVAAQVGYHALHGDGRVVAQHGRRVAAIPVGNRYTAAVGIQQNLAAVKAQPPFRFEGAVGSESVQLTWLQAGDEHVPEVEGSVFGAV